MHRTTSTELALELMAENIYREVEVSYEVLPASGDGWHEPHIPARVELHSITLDIGGKPVDLYPLLTDKQRHRIEADLMREVSEPDPDFLRDRAFDHSY